MSETSRLVSSNSISSYWMRRATTAHKKYSYFKPQHELWIMYMPPIALALSVWHVFWGPQLSQRFIDICQQFLNIVMLDSVHLIFTFIFLICFVEGRTLIHATASVVGPFKFWFTVCLCSGAIYVASFLSMSPLQNSNFQNVVLQFFDWFWLIVPPLHGMKQSYGLSLAMNQSLLSRLRDAKEKAAFLESDRRERKIANVYFIVCTCALVCSKFSRTFPILTPLKYVLVLASMACVVQLLIELHRNKSFSQTHKALFNIRLLLWPLGVLSIVAVWGTAICHTMEYLGLMSKFYRRTGEGADSARSVKYSLVALSLVAFTFFIGGIHFSFVWFEISAVSGFSLAPAVVYCLSFLTFITVGHLVLDALIYRFRYKSVARWVGPLVKGFESV